MPIKTGWGKVSISDVVAHWGVIDAYCAKVGISPTDREALHIIDGYAMAILPEHTLDEVFDVSQKTESQMAALEALAKKDVQAGEKRPMLFMEIALGKLFINNRQSETGGIRCLTSKAG